MLLLREKEDIEDRHERHQLVPSCCQKPQKSPACLHCRDLTTIKYIGKVSMNTRARQWSCTANILHCFANLELSETSRAATADSAGLSQPHIPTLFLISPHNDLAGGGNSLKDRKKQGFYRWHISSMPTVGCAVCLQAAPQVKQRAG